MIVCIGNAPSSGSTYLADLFDSLPFAVCGPELHLFSPECHYKDFARLKKQGRCRSATPSVYAAYGVRASYRDLAAYGFTPQSWRHLLAHSGTFPAFCRDFFETFSAFREKDVRLYVEKTPENVHQAGAFLEAFPDGRFLHVVRDPIAVFRSLRRRGFPFAAAAAAWLIDVAGAQRVEGHPRAMTVRYEDLVADPDGEMAKLLSWLGSPKPPAPVADLLAANQYRKATPHLDAWGMDADGRKKDVDDGGEDAAASALMRHMRISKPYARHFSLPQTDMASLAAEYGYTLPDSGSALIPTLDPPSRLLWAKKWAWDAATANAGLGALPIYLTPIDITCVA